MSKQHLTAFLQNSLQNHYPHQEPPKETFKTSTLPDHPTQLSPWCLTSGTKTVFAAPLYKLYLSREGHQLKRWVKTENFFKRYSLLSSVDSARSNGSSVHQVPRTLYTTTQLILRAPKDSAMISPLTETRKHIYRDQLARPPIIKA